MQIYAPATPATNWCTTSVAPAPPAGSPPFPETCRLSPWIFHPFSPPTHSCAHKMAVLWRHCFTPVVLRSWLLVVLVDYCRYCQVGERRKTPKWCGQRRQGGGGVAPVARIEVLVVMLLIGLAFSNASCAPKQSRSRGPNPNPNPKAEAPSKCSTYIHTYIQYIHAQF